MRRFTSLFLTIITIMLTPLKNYAASIAPIAIPLSSISDRLREQLNAPGMLDSIRTELRNHYGGNGLIDGFIFLGIVGDSEVIDGKACAGLTVWFGIQDTRADNFGAALGRAFVPVRVKAGRLVIDSDAAVSRAVDVAAKNDEWVPIANQLRAGMKRALDNAGPNLRPLISKAIDEEIGPRLQNAPPVIADVEISRHQVLIHLDPTKPATMMARPSPELYRLSPPFSEGRQNPALPVKVGDPDNAVLVVTLFRHHVWLTRATFARGFGAGSFATPTAFPKVFTLFADVEDTKRPGDYSVTFFLGPNEHVDLTKLPKGAPFDDKARIVAVRPGPKYAGHKIRMFWDREKRRGPQWDLGVGDHQLHMLKLKVKGKDKTVESQATEMRVIP